MRYMCACVITRSGVLTVSHIMISGVLTVACLQWISRLCLFQSQKEKKPAAKHTQTLTYTQAAGSQRAEISVRACVCHHHYLTSVLHGSLLVVGIACFCNIMHTQSCAVLENYSSTQLLFVFCECACYPSSLCVIHLSVTVQLCDTHLQCNRIHIRSPAWTSPLYRIFTSTLVLRLRGKTKLILPTTKLKPAKPSKPQHHCAPSARPSLNPSPRLVVHRVHTTMQISECMLAVLNRCLESLS